MNTILRDLRQKEGAARPLCGYPRWLRTWAAALGLLLRGKLGPESLLWAADDAAELLAAGFPGLLAVPERLFAQTAALFPGRLRLAAAGRGEDELLAAVREIERLRGARFDWDAFLAACARQNRRAACLLSLSEALASLAPPSVDARTPQAALRDMERIVFSF